MMRYSLETILRDDPHRLLEEIARFSGKKSETERLIASFAEISEFFVEHQRLPQRSKEDIIEFALACRLAGIRNNPDKKQIVAEHDIHKLLAKRQLARPQTVADILDTDPHALFDDTDDSIFDLQHVPSKQPDYVAGRKPCRDFTRFKKLFARSQAELKAGSRQLVKFKQESTIAVGEFFVLNGIMLYVAAIADQKSNPRLRCIFANGMESDLLRRSLASGLYKDGRRIVAREAGWIYIVRSKSDDPRITSLKNLYKIGYSKTAVKKRLAKAEQSATYLYAPVEVIATFKCYNLKPQKLEHLLHKFFAGCCLDLQIDGHAPREWFIVPLPVIKQAIELLIEGTIGDYHYDAEAEMIVRD